MMGKLDFPRPTVTDAVAGASVAMVLIPQSSAYAKLAGLPPHIGLFASAFPVIAFSLCASSPFLQTGPTAVISLLTFASLPDVDPVELPKLAALLALMVGVFRFALGFARLGVLVRLIALPVVTGEDLLFRRWDDDASLQDAGFGALGPAPTATELRPAVVLAPLVGCDRRGGRLGQGKGYYDRALARLDAAGDVFVVGVACDGQLLPAVPTEAHDRRLDAVLTEREWIALSE